MQKKRSIKIISVVLIIVLICISVIYAKSDNSYVLATTSTYNTENLQDNEHMHVELDSSGDKVPVPNGYVGSKAEGEDEIDTGYVIYEGEEEVNNDNVEEAQKTRNQYVWIPVPDASTMYGTDENGKKWGKLYTFTTGTGADIDSVTGAKPLNWSEENGVMKIVNVKSSKEPDIIIGSSNGYDIDARLKNLKIDIRNTHDFLIQLEEEFDIMIKSVEKYGGFYIGRYEAGKDSQKQTIIRKYKKASTYINWYESYKEAKTLINMNSNVVTNLIWGNQWNRTLIWLIESGNKTKEEICVNSKSWGNYKDSTFEFIDENGKTNIKEENKSTEILTGSAEYTVANNIYDLAGNYAEWSMATSIQEGTRLMTSGSCYNTSSNSADHISNYGPTVSQSATSFRVVLYIK